MRPIDDKGFLVVREPYGDGGFRNVARFRCVECGATHDRTIKSGVPLNAEALANSATNAGWIADGYKRQICRCPTCKNKKTRNDPNIELKKVHMSTSAPIAQLPARDPTPEQRLKIRGMLDKHFDDASGAYLDAMTDEKIAQSLGLPRVFVERIRDAAYGPIKVSPEVQTILAALRKAQEDIAAVQKRVDDLAQRIQKLNAA